MAEPTLFDYLEPEERALMVFLARGSVRDWAAIRALLPLEDRSKSSVHRDSQEAGSVLLRVLNERPLGHLNLAAIVIDGTPIGGRNVLWAMGVTMDGQKIPLAAVEDHYETGESVRELFDNLDRRGLDLSDTLHVIDGGTALVAEITRRGGTIQRCRLHKARNVVMGHLRAMDRALIVDAMGTDLDRAVRTRLDEAWEKPTFDEAREALEGVAAWLDEMGFGGAADSVRDGMEMTLTLQRLGLTHPALIFSFGTTNMIESVHTRVSDAKRLTTNWQPPEEDGRLRVLAASVAVAERKWEKVVADRATLEAMSFAVMTARHFGGREWAVASDLNTITVTQLPTRDAQAYLALWELLRFADRNGKVVEIGAEVVAGLDATDDPRSWLVKSGFADIQQDGAGYVRAPHPPGAMDWAKLPSADFSVRKLAVPSEDAAIARGLVAEALGQERDDAPAIVCHGSPEALWSLGLERGQRLTLDELTLAARGQHVSEGTRARWSSTIAAVKEAEGLEAERVEAEGLEAEGVEAADRVKGVSHLAWELNLPGVAERWREEDAAGRAAIERAVLGSAEVAVARAAREGGVAGAVTLEVDAEGGGMRLRGVVFGVARGGPFLSSPIDRRVFRTEQRLKGVEIAAASDAVLRIQAELARMGPRRPIERAPEVAAESAEVAGYLAALDERSRAWVDAQAESYRARVLGDWGLGALRQERGKLRNPFVHLTPSVNVDAWMGNFRLDAVRLVAVSRELAERDRALEKGGKLAKFLEEKRELLGGRRLKEFAESVEKRMKTLAYRSTKWLKFRRTQAGQKMEQIDRDDAALTLWIERTRADNPNHPKLAEAEQRLGDRAGALDKWRAAPQHAVDHVATRALMDERKHEKAAERSGESKDKEVAEADLVGADQGM